MIYSILEGDFLVSVAGGHAYSGPLPGFYGDEFLTIIRGELTPTDKATGHSQVFRRGDGVLIPMGFERLPRTDAGGGERGSRVLCPSGLPQEVFQAGERIVISRTYKGEVLLRGGYEALMVSGVQ